MSSILFIVTKSSTGGAQKWVKEQIDICHRLFKCHLATNEIGWLTKNAKTSHTYLTKFIERRFSLKYLLLLNIYKKK